MPDVTSRWQWVLLKYFLAARKAKEFSVQVATALRRLMTMSPRLVWIVAWYLALKSGRTGGLPTLREAGGLAGYVQCLAGSACVGVGVGVAAGGVGVATADGLVAACACGP